MLVSLHVKNLALIDEEEILFGCRIVPAHHEFTVYEVTEMVAVHDGHQAILEARSVDHLIVVTTGMGCDFIVVHGDCAHEQRCLR